MVESLGISLAGGAELAVFEDGWRWPTTAEAFRGLKEASARADREAERADREAVRADRETERAHRLEALLRQAGADPGA
jgi:hypothetical protein